MNLSSRRPNRLVIVAAAGAVLAGVLLPAASAVSQDRSALAPAAAARMSPLNGTVVADGSPVTGATVRLFVAGETPGDATQLQAVTTDRVGGFTFAIPASVADGDVLYATASGGQAGARAVPPEVELATALGDLRSGRVVIDELTTVAAGYSLAQFAEDGVLGGASPGLGTRRRWRAISSTSRRAPRRGSCCPRRTATSTETLSNVGSLASIIAGCVAGTNDCAAFLDAATDAWGIRPATTWQAMTLLPTNPSGDPAAVLAQVPANPRFTPVRTTVPSGWFLALKFWGNGHQFNGPGNVAFDAQGRVWANTNATWSNNPKHVCPGEEVFLLDPYAKGQRVAAFDGGGLNGSGFGVAFDPQERLWVTNFGFTGSLCPERRRRTASRRSTSRARRCRALRATSPAR